MSILLLRLWTGLLLIAERFINWLASSHIQQGCYGHSQLPLQTCATSHTLNDRRMHQYYLMASDSLKAGFGLHSSMSMLGDITVVFFLHLPIFLILKVRCLPVFCSTKSHIPYCHHEKISRGMSKMSAGSTDKQSNKIFSLPHLALMPSEAASRPPTDSGSFAFPFHPACPFHHVCLSCHSCSCFFFSVLCRKYLTNFWLSWRVV